MFDETSLTPHAEDHDIVITRHFTAPRALMFQVFTQPEHLTRWWAPLPYTLPACSVDLRPGGVWRYCMRSPEGQDNWVRNVYREITPPEKLVYTTTFADAQGNPIEGIPEHQTTVLFTETADGTQVTARAQFASAEALRAAIDMRMSEGMNQTWDALVEYVHTLPQA